jgi:hypothetical protein
MNTLWGTILGGVCALAVSLPTQLVIGSPPFIKVHRLEYIDGKIIVDRTAYTKSGKKEFADWRVAVVPVQTSDVSADLDYREVCSTISGPKLHQGWSDYEPGRSIVQMSLDTWVGDPGCKDALPSGATNMHVSWYPRDGSSPSHWKGQIVIE